MSTTTLIEPCCGTAAVTCHALGRRRPVAYRGSKLRLAEQILDVIGLDAPPSTVVLSDAGSWGETWAALADPATCSRMARILTEWGAPMRARWSAAMTPTEQARVGRRLNAHTRGLRDLLVSRPPPTDLAHRATAHLYLSSRTFSGAPVTEQGGAWRTNGYRDLWSQTAPHLVRAAPWLLAETIAALRDAPWPEVEARRCDASAVRVRGRKGRVVVYLDPPYAGKAKYKHRLDRASVLALARKWYRQGADVYVSEGVDLSGDLGAGWRATPIRRSRATYGPGHALAYREWLTYRAH